MNDIPCTYRLSVKAIIKDNDDRILLIREKNGSWEFPGGGLAHGEKSREGLVREIAEETGLRVVSVSENPVAFWTIYKDVGSPVLKWFAFVAYSVKVAGAFRPDPSSDEAEEGGYFTESEAANLQLHENTKHYFL